MGCLFQKSLAYLAGNTIGTADGVTVATPEQTPVYTPPSQQAATLDNMLGSPLAGILGGHHLRRWRFDIHRLLCDYAGRGYGRYRGGGGGAGWYLVG
jgi:hypothetical protein